MLILVKELHIRVGKECYARINKSYGITSLKKNISHYLIHKLNYVLKVKVIKDYHIVPIIKKFINI
jgi:DNA topoisomerase IB